MDRYGLDCLQETLQFADIRCEEFLHKQIGTTGRNDAHAIEVERQVVQGRAKRNTACEESVVAGRVAPPILAPRRAASIAGVHQGLVAINLKADALKLLCDNISCCRSEVRRDGHC